MSEKSSAGTAQYVYDALDQLVKETRPDGTVYEYTYDAVGNRLSKKVTKGSSVTTTAYTYDDANQLKTINGTTVQHDANGNLTGDGDRTYVYDAENRLTTVKDKSGNNMATFTYRADGMRKTMTTSAGTITFHYDENKNVVYETDGNNQVVASYTYGPNNEPVSMMRDGQTYYYQMNGHGDVVALTNTSGTVVATYEYDAFGNLIKETGTVKNPYRYAGYRYDEVTGLYYLQSRYYNPTTGRFLTKDTFAGFEDDPLSQNKYTYAHNNPIIFVDPDGHMVVALPLFFVPGIGWVALGGVLAVYGGIYIGKQIAKLRTSKASFDIPSSLLKKDKKTVNLGKFTQKVKGKVAYKDPKTKWIIEKDTAGHAGKKWKLKNKSGKRIASLDKNGKIISK